jgi:hypothetical protein
VVVESAEDGARLYASGQLNQVLHVPLVEPRETRVGRFGWKNQHASLLSFTDDDAYLSEMRITALVPNEVTKLCNTASEPNDPPGPDGLDDLDKFARFISATKARGRDHTVDRRGY